MSIDKARKDKQGKKKKRYIFRFAVLAILLGAIVYALIINLNQDKDLYEVGDQAPDFKLTQINEANEVETIQLSELEGKGVMLNFWGTWCKPCEEEMPYMEELYPKYKDDVEIVAVSLDVDEPIIHNFIHKYDLTFPVVHDKNSDVMNLYNVGPIPSTFFISPEGKIVGKVAGSLSLESLEENFKAIQP